MPAEASGSNDFVEAQKASSGDLHSRLPRAGTDYLQGALQNPHLSEKHLESILANPALPATAIQQIAAKKKWLARYEIQRALVMHRNTPRALKLNLLHSLRWRDLARVVEDPQCAPPVKRAAETLLRARTSEMAVGEKIALARVASPGVISSLTADSHPEVVAALLGNGRMTEEQVVALCSEERVPVEVLGAVAGNPRWRERYPVKMALLRNPRTPAGASMKFLHSLLSGDLTEIVSSGRAPRLVRATAKQILRSRADFVDRNGALT